VRSGSALRHSAVGDEAPVLFEIFRRPGRFAPDIRLADCRPRERRDRGVVVLMKCEKDASSQQVEGKVAKVNGPGGAIVRALRRGDEDLLALGEPCDFVGMGCIGCPPDRIGALAPGHRPQEDEVCHTDSCLCRVHDVEGAAPRGVERRARGGVGKTRGVKPQPSVLPDLCMTPTRVEPALEKMKPRVELRIRTRGEKVGVTACRVVKEAQASGLKNRARTRGLFTAGA
jgi:hypothetical protein